MNSIQIFVLRLVRLLTRPVGYRGWGFLTNFIGNRIFDPDRTISVPIHNSTTLRIFLNDPYWMLMVVDDREFEKGVGHALKRLLAADTLFLDCGANHGYWSLLGAECQATTVAVEADADNYDKLMWNCQENGDGFVCVHAAVAAESGLTVRLKSVGYNHAGIFVAGYKVPRRGAAMDHGSTQTTTIDDLVAEHSPTANAPIVIKLDVEGSEVEALKGAPATMRDRNVTFIFEDLVAAYTASAGDYLRDWDFSIVPIGEDNFVGTKPLMPSSALQRPGWQHPV